MKLSRSRWVLVVALAVTVVAAVLAPAEADPAVALSQQTRSKAEALRRGDGPQTRLAPLPVSPSMGDLRERGELERTSRVFDPPAWTTEATRQQLVSMPVPPKPSAHVASAPIAIVAPTAPPLPFRALGWYLDGDRKGVFLQYQGNNVVAHVGDTIAAQYLVESWTERTISLRYLPLNQIQTLDLEPH